MKAKLLTVIIFFSFLSCYGQDRVQISVINNTMDNIEINFVGGRHVQPEESYHVITLFGDLPTGSFKVCRGYGCLATVTVVVNFPEPLDKGTMTYRDKSLFNTPDLFKNC